MAILVPASVSRSRSKLPSPGRSAMRCIRFARKAAAALRVRFWNIVFLYRYSRPHPILSNEIREGGRLCTAYAQPDSSAFRLEADWRMDPHLSVCWFSGSPYCKRLTRLEALPALPPATTSHNSQRYQRHASLNYFTVAQLNSTRASQLQARIVSTGRLL